LRLASAKDRRGTIDGSHLIALINAHIVGGMSGSPSLDTRGRMVGVVTSGRLVNGEEAHEQFGQASVINCLPIRLLAGHWPSACRHFQRLSPDNDVRGDVISTRDADSTLVMSGCRDSTAA
jgi:hypothetical protein